jgi:hypothetical protein
VRELFARDKAERRGKGRRLGSTVEINTSDDNCSPSRERWVRDEYVSK